MDGNDNNSDKVTIRVKISDDDYQDIHFDWSKVHTHDVDKSIFEQLSAFTGIKTEAVRCMGLRNLGPQMSTNISNPIFNKPGFHRYPYSPHDRSDPELISMRDGDCYRLYAYTRFDFDLTCICVMYTLLHQDLVDETECNINFCLQKGSRVFLDKLAKVVNSDIDSYLNNLPDRPRPSVMPGSDVMWYDEEWLDRRDLKVQEICRDLNIGQYLLAYCPANLGYDIQRRFPRLYCRNRG
ncbi:uncharacterized protein LOC107368193 [Tetranychus urticae]|uniref:Uncharacterized protein n=1 Tax=Tetranychus urticae TaxID=32264 RepID=T1KY45_TETUR|nr:uncharacterized protein LOC107368193 [Tetranychus urticae]